MAGKRRQKQSAVCSRVKRIMQADVEVGKIAGPTPTLISKALEMFLKELCDGASEIAVQREVRTLAPGHLKQYVMHAQRMDFLKDKFTEVPDLPEHLPGPGLPQKPKAPKPKKRQRQDNPESTHPVVKLGKGGNEAPVLQQMPDSTPFISPPIAAGSSRPGAMNSQLDASWAGEKMAAAAAPGPPASIDGLQAVAAVAPTAADSFTGAAQTVFAAPGVDAGMQIQAQQPVAAEEDDYDAD